MKIAMLFPYAPAYRGPIYELMDKEFDIDWYFANNVKPPLKLYDYSRLKKCYTFFSQQTIFKRVVRYKGIWHVDFSQYDVIITPSNIRNVSIWKMVLRYAGKGKKPYFYFWTHGWYGRENRIETVIKRYFLSRADGIFAYNERSCHLMEDVGLDGKRLYTIYNSLNYDAQLVIRNTLSPSSLYQQHFKNTNKNIVFIGRLTSEKRFDLLVNSVHDLKERGLDVNLTLIGDGDERENLEKLVIEKGVAEQVWFYGACYDELKNAELIYNSDLCVSPGNIGLTAMHVLMFGCPAITSNDFAHQGPEFEAIKEGVTGLFFLPNDVSSLSDSIRSWFDLHQDDRDTVRQECYKEIDQKWNPHKQISVLKEVLTKLG